MRIILSVIFATGFVSLVVFGQAQPTKEPLSGNGCADVTAKLKKLTVGKMKVKTCCGGLALIADVKQENGQKKIANWYIRDANGKEIVSEKGSDYTNGTEIVQSKVPKACFIVGRGGN